MASNIFGKLTAGMSAEFKESVGKISTGIRTPGIHLVKLKELEMFINERSKRLSAKFENKDGETLYISTFLEGQDFKTKEKTNIKSAFDFLLFVMNITSNRTDITLHNMENFLEDKGTAIVKSSGETTNVVSYTAGVNKELYIASYTSIEGKDKGNIHETVRTIAKQEVDPYGVFHPRTKLSYSELERKVKEPKDFEKKLEEVKTKFVAGRGFKEHLNVKQEIELRLQELNKDSTGTQTPTNTIEVTKQENTENTPQVETVTSEQEPF
jgi:hypothetical protein